MLDQESIHAELSRDIKHAIATALWNTPCSHIKPGLDFYFKYYVKQCELIALQDGGSHASARTHGDIMQIVQLLKDSRTRDEIHGQLLPFSDAVKGGSRTDLSIDLAARLLLMIEFGALPYAYSGFRPLEWTQGSLPEFVTERFDNRPKLGHDNIKLQKVFNACNLERIAGIEVIWTANLADHLRLMKDDTAVAVFHHASFLKRQQCDDTLFPKEFIDETLDTMALLFPKWDRNTRVWYEHEASVRSLDTYLIQIGHLDADKRQIENFKYWHDRVVVLKQVFDEARPRTVWQWWHDRRDGVQWYTFWVAIFVLLLTVFFGLVQSIEGALQVYAAFRT